MMAAGSKEVVSALRSLMQAEGLAALVVPSEDAHQSEYVPLRDRRREFVSGFTGSAGTVVLTGDQALLWTDGRYFLQAEKELGPGWVLMRALEKDVPTVSKWLADNLPQGGVVGVNGLLISSGQAKSWSKELEGKGVSLRLLERDLVDAVWGPHGQPPPPAEPVRPHPLEYAGQSIEEKLADIRAKVKGKGASSLLVTALDELAWLYNIRGGDVEFNPVTIAYSVVRQKEAVLFIDHNKLTPEAAQHLSSAGVSVRGYDCLSSYLTSPGSLPADEAVLVDPNLVSANIVNLLQPASVVEGPSPITMAKACKNERELEGMRQAHIRDGAALVAFLAWLEDAMLQQQPQRPQPPHGQQPPAAGKEEAWKQAGGEEEEVPLTEAGVCAKLEAFRRAQDKFVSLSFATIAGVGANGSIIHYKPDEQQSAPLRPELMFLLDSGAQYQDGTTDVTRTVHFGQPSEEEKRAFTLVLKGHIALAQARFPEGTMGHKLDILARLPLWSQGLDYKHGTGHGVGAFLNVHEGPQSISYKKRAYEEGLYPGMVTSNEPGFYADGKFGIRIESIIICKQAHTPHQFGGVRYCEFETITMAPIQAKLLDLALLSASERAWLDHYHATVRDTLAPRLAHDARALAYLQRETAPLPPPPL